MKRTEKVEVRLTPEEKLNLEQKAKAVGVSQSVLIRSLLQSDHRIVVLGDGQNILANLYKIHEALEKCLAFKSLTLMDASSLRNQMIKITAALCSISDYLSELSEDEEDNEDVDTEDGQ